VSHCIHNFHIFPVATGDDGGSGSSAGVIIGGVVAAVICIIAVVIAVLVAIFFAKRSHLRKKYPIDGNKGSLKGIVGWLHKNLSIAMHATTLKLTYSHSFIKRKIADILINRYITFLCCFYVHSCFIHRFRKHGYC